MSAIVLERNDQAGVEMLRRSNKQLVVRIFRPATDETIEHRAFNSRLAADKYYALAVSAGRDTRSALTRLDLDAARNRKRSR